MTKLEALLRGVIADQIFGTGVQVNVRLGNAEIYDFAAGTCGDLPVDSHSVHPTYCATKPLIPLAIGLLMEEGRLNLSMKVRELVPAASWVQPWCTIGDLLTHRAGLKEPSAAIWRMTPRQRRQELFSVRAERAEVAYSELSGWFALAEAIGAISGDDVGDFVNQRILKPAGLTEMAVTPDAAIIAREAGFVRVPVDGLPDKPIPLLSEQLPCQLEDISPVFGGLASMRSLAGLYSMIGESLAGEVLPGIPSRDTLCELLSCRREAAFDAVLQRTCEFSGGFMSDLNGHGVSSSLSRSSIGHVAGFANCFGLLDPPRRLSVAAYVNGVSGRRDDLEYLRSRITDAVLDEFVAA